MAAARGTSRDVLARGARQFSARVASVDGDGPAAGPGADRPSVSTSVCSMSVIWLSAGGDIVASGTLVHLVTLPVELDASYGKALPILRAGNYIQPGDEAGVRRVLRAAALTYVAGSLASLLNLARWLAYLRRV